MRHERKCGRFSALDSVGALPWTPPAKVLIAPRLHASARSVTRGRHAEEVPFAFAGPARLFSLMGAYAGRALLHEDHLHLRAARGRPRPAASRRRQGWPPLHLFAQLSRRRVVRDPRPGGPL